MRGGARPEWVSYDAPKAQIPVEDVLGVGVLGLLSRVEQGVVSGRVMVR